LTSLTPPSTPSAFFRWLKNKSELHWQTVPINHQIYGFQVQPGAHWNPGLSSTEIEHFEADLGFSFPPILKTFLATMNGTDKPYVNLYGDSGEPPKYAAGYYSYPRDLSQIRDLIGWIYDSNHVTPEAIEAKTIPHIFPLVAHRFLIIDRCKTHPVLSMYGDDIILYALTLQVFLVNDIFHQGAPSSPLPNTFTVKFWLDEHP
jgi:hypothetical protein